MAHRVFVAGHRGMVGSAIVRVLERASDVELVVRPRAALDLTDQPAVRAFFADGQIDEVYLAAARVGGIFANSAYPADFIADNLAIQSNVIDGAFRAGVRKLLFLGSSCIYPRLAPQPITESALLTGPLEPTNLPYAVAKIAGIVLCDSLNRQHGTDYRCVMPTNLYGIGDNYHGENSHVIPALLRRFDEARRAGLDHVAIWGSGTPLREFLHVDDMATASIHVMNLPRDRLAPTTTHINVGSNDEISILDLATLVAEVVGYRGAIVTDPSKPDGTPRKKLDNALLTSLGWTASIGLRDGLTRTYADYCASDARR